MKFIDKFLNSITMYRLMLYGLICIASISILFSFLGFLSFNGFSLIISLPILFFVCYFSNLFFAKMFRAITNAESSAITALILFLILSPGNTFIDFLVVGIAGMLAMLSKYVLAIHKKHIFNPTAIALFLIGLFGSSAVIWWVGSAVLLPFVAIFGFLILRKLHRFSLFFTFLVSSLLMISLFSFINKFNLLDTLLTTFTSWPLIFFGTVMLTEPLTTPPSKKLQIIYAAIVGMLFGSQFHIGPLFATPEFALIIGNIFSYIVSPKQKLFLHLKEKRQIAKDCYEFIFINNKPFSFLPGQYMEWTVPIPSKPDARGNRRFFTIASSPTEPEIKLGIRYNTPSSAFKKELMDIKPTTTIIASQLAGEFVLPEDTKQKIAFVAGGIGITPIRSMIKYLIDKKGGRDMVLFYACKNPEDIAYKDIFDQAEKEIGLHVIYLFSECEELPKNMNAKEGRLSANVIKEELPDFAERKFYLSGPDLMIRNYKQLLLDMHIPRTNILTDYFPGF